MSGPLVSASAAFVAKNSRIPPYAIEQSLRIDGSAGARLTRTPSSSGNRRTFTLSMWFKRVVVTPSNHDFLFATNQSWFADYFHAKIENADATLNLSDWPGGTSGTPRIGRKTLGVFRDYSAWTHYVVAIDTTDATAQNRARVYLNGVEQTSFSTNYDPAQNAETTWNHTVIHTLGNFYDTGGTNSYNDKYLAEIHNVDGQQLDASSFGEFDDNGVWRPIKYTGTYGTNGFYLKFDPTAANGVGHDHSGNGHHFSTTGVITSGTGTDVMSDTPTTNWCTLNPGYKAVSGATLSEGNLKVAYPSAPPTGMHVGTLATTNAFYVEAKATAATSNQILLGVDSPDRGNINNNYPGGGPDGWGYGMNGRIYNNSSTVVDTGTTYTINDVIGIACDPSNGTIEFFKNGTSVYSGTSVANVPLTICVAQTGGSGNSGTIEINCGQRVFEQTAPSGFSPLNTSNLPAPTVKDGSKNFNTVLYTGNGTDNHAITGVGFQPSFTWLKTRSVADNHVLHDEVRGANRQLFTNSTDYEFTATTLLKSFDSDGFTLGTDSGANGSSRTFVAWNWLASNTSGSSNTDGSITSTVSANPSAGFSIVNFTGTGANATVGHGLGVAPDLLILKNRDDGLQDWPVYHSALGATKQMVLSSGATASTNSVYWNDTEPTSTVFTVGTAGNTNGSGDKTIAYCFAEVEGYSKFGIYERNGSSDGPYIYLGFTPALILIKEYAAGTENWTLFDNKRLGYNPNDTPLWTASNQSETYIQSTYANEIDFLSNGFKIRTSDSMYNSSLSSYRYLYAAWAVNPFGGSGVNPATAR